MKFEDNGILLSAHDLSGHIACPHLTYLELAVAKGEAKSPAYRDPLLAILQERGQEFEKSYLKSLEKKGLKIGEPFSDDNNSSVTNTISLMKEGVDIIYQASLKNGNWQGRADFLIKVAKSSKLGDWSYEVIDSKLANETRAGTILQLCLYSELLANIQGIMPELMHVVTPEDGFSQQSFRLDDFNAYYRFVKNRLENIIKNDDGKIPTYPIPCAHCEICNWWQQCDSQRRFDDHLSLVAGLSNSHNVELNKWEIKSLKALGQTPLPFKQKPSRGAIETYNKLREQARVQFEARESQKAVFEYLEIQAGHGFFKLPEPNENDFFFDLESDPFAGRNGLEYLFGWIKGEGTTNYYSIWAMNPIEEKLAFEKFVDTVIGVWKENPLMHIYHYSPYEPAALKRLMGKHGTRENEIDDMLRAGLFIDLLSVTKQAIRAGVESYSLKQLEVFHNFKREVDLRDASLQLKIFERFIERNNTKDIPDVTKRIVETYNKEDCLSTKNLRDWLEQLRDAHIKEGNSISRPEISDGAANESITEHQQRIQPIFDKLISGVPIDAAERNPEQQANWLLANMLDWYRREKKSFWWEYFRLCELSENELIEEKSAIAGLQYANKRTPDKKSVIDLYTFPPQECDIRIGDDLKTNEGNALGTVSSIDTFTGKIEIRKGPKNIDIHPRSVFKHSDIRDKEKEDAIIRIASWVANNNINAEGEYRAGRDLLINLPPRSAAFKNVNDAQTNAVAWVQALQNGVLPIQGPPGAGKSHTAAEMILTLIQSGKKVGITALSHKVIGELLKKVVEAGIKKKINVKCLKKVSTVSENPDPQIIEETKNDKVVDALHHDEINVFGGTPWLWAREDMANSVDVLFVDEAGQLSLIDTVAVSQAASNLVLLGDPQQLKQPQQGSHPEGTEVSALEHILKEHKTMPPDRGIFLDVTWRLHPDICKFISELFYEGRLVPKEELTNQKLDGNTKFSGAGLSFIPVDHNGNQSSSKEEVEVVTKIVSELIKSEIYYINSKNVRARLTENDVKVIAPYNAQVNLLQSALPNSIAIGTVDKFQGQEAPVVIFSMATSTPEDAPRGMEFLYSLNRLNVAASRAKCRFILVGNPKLFEPNCKSVQQMRLANAFCRFLELANYS